jgi:hypothetical protein
MLQIIDLLSLWYPLSGCSVSESVKVWYIITFIIRQKNLRQIRRELIVLSL